MHGLFPVSTPLCYPLLLSTIMAITVQLLTTSGKLWILFYSNAYYLFFNICLLKTWLGALPSFNSAQKFSCLGAPPSFMFYKDSETKESLLFIIIIVFHIHQSKVVFPCYTFSQPYFELCSL